MASRGKSKDMSNVASEEAELGKLFGMKTVKRLKELWSHLEMYSLDLE